MVNSSSPMMQLSSSFTLYIGSMKVISVNVGQATAVQVGNQSKITGIRKHPVPGQIKITKQGLEGDHIMDKKHHGGPDQAVYIYTREDYDAWAELLGHELEPGIFGENLLISGLESEEVCIGDRLQAGDVLLEVSGVRIPCGTLGARMEDAGFVKRFVKMRRPGFYTRVLESGEIKRGDTIKYTAAQDAPKVTEIFDLVYIKDKNKTRLEELKQYPLAERLRKNIEQWLQEK